MRPYQTITADREAARAKLAALRDEGIELSELKAKTPEQWTDGIAERATRISKGIEHAEARLAELDGEFREALSAFAAAHPENLEGAYGTGSGLGIRGMLGGSRASYAQPLDWGAEFIAARGGLRASLFDPGSTAVTVPLAPTPIADARAARFLFQLCPSENAPSGAFSHLRQTARTSNAAVVATGALKPTSVYTVERVDSKTVVIAHLSEAIDKFLFEDAPMLRDFLNTEMVYGLNKALDERLKDAILAVAADGGSTVDLAAVRSAITDLQESDMEPTAIAMSPADLGEHRSRDRVLVLR